MAQLSKSRHQLSISAGVSSEGSATNDTSMLVASWVPTNLTWSAATIAQTGEWKSVGGSGTKGTMTFTGSTATALGGSMGMFDTRVYNYEPSLLYLQPPWFPLINDSLTTILFRELST